MSQAHLAIALLSLIMTGSVHGAAIGINVLLNQPATPEILADLDAHGNVLDVIPEINAVTMRAQPSSLAAIQALPFVAAANADRKRSFKCVNDVSVPDFANGANQWSLDAINVTDAGATPSRTVDYDGEGVYVAVLDTGLVKDWRSYFPEERIATQFARAFGGGGGDNGTVSSQPNKWQTDTNGHGTAVTSVILGFHYAGPEALPQTFNGVAPRATVIPVRCNTRDDLEFWSSVGTRALVYLTNLKTSGALGESPLVINMSFGSDFNPDYIELAAIDYAIANGVVIVASGGNEGESGMSHPAAYAPVISAGATGFVGQFPEDDPTTIEWILDDVLEGDASEHLIASFSSRELPGQDLDVVAPGMAVPMPWQNQQGQIDYAYFGGSSAACPFVAGVAALLLEKNPDLSQSQIEGILESTAMPLPPGCRDLLLGFAGPGNPPTWSDHSNVFFLPATICWDTNATGAGLVQADAAINATPLP